MVSPQQVIEKTKKWINEVIVGCNFCPFAARVIKQQTVHYRVESGTTIKNCLSTLAEEASRLDTDVTIETSFLIFPNTFSIFADYLYFLAAAEKSLKQNGYEGIYQLASFHPLYRFANATENDAANYSNRSVYPMLHLLREDSITKALENYKNPENIPHQNIHFARKKGLTYMKMLRDTCI